MSDYSDVDARVLLRQTHGYWPRGYAPPGDIGGHWGRPAAATRPGRDGACPTSGAEIGLVAVAGHSAARQARRARRRSVGRQVDAGPRLRRPGSTGAAMPDGFDGGAGVGRHHVGRGRPGRHDPPPSDAAAADLTRVFAITAITVTAAANSRMRPPSIPDDIAQLEASVIDRRRPRHRRRAHRVPVVGDEQLSGPGRPPRARPAGGDGRTRPAAASSCCATSARHTGSGDLLRGRLDRHRRRRSCRTDGRVRSRRRRVEDLNERRRCSPSSRTTSGGSLRACRYRIVEAGTASAGSSGSAGSHIEPTTSSTVSGHDDERNDKERSCAICWPTARLCRYVEKAGPCCRVDGGAVASHPQEARRVSPTGRLPRTDDVNVSPRFSQPSPLQECEEPDDPAPLGGTDWEEF